MASPNPKLDQLVIRLESHLECWKEFNRFFAFARSKEFEDNDESQFLEVKSLITQDLEMILSQVEASSPSKEEILNLISATPSIRYLSQLDEPSLRNLENQWHRIYIAWHSMLGQLKVHQQQPERKGLFNSLLGRKK